MTHAPLIPVKDFRATPVSWYPYVTPVQLETATDVQLAAMKVTPSNRKISYYTLTLAHDPEILSVRSPLFNDIMYHRGGLSRGYRELAATETSVVNGCFYCASVHSARYIQLTKDAIDIEILFNRKNEQQVNSQKSIIISVANQLSQPIPTFEKQSSTTLSQHLDAEEVIDLIFSISLFNWANRLMHSLGQAVEPSENP
ncbi:peroxidase-related enzyme [Acetobacter orientalis]|uniref:peroxidase-related enzyme n=1 Tax=Acetobacter orientalis TaxID=146474 RepID=UPI0039ECF1A3